MYVIVQVAVIFFIVAFSGIGQQFVVVSPPTFIMIAHFELHEMGSFVM